MLLQVVACCIRTLGYGTIRKQSTGIRQYEFPAFETNNDGVEVKLISIGHKNISVGVEQQLPILAAHREQGSP